MVRVLSAFSLVCGLAVLTTGCQKSLSPDVAATVNGRPITYSDLDKEFQMQFGTGQAPAADDQVAIQKMEVLRSMVDNEIMLQRAEKLNLQATDADVDTKVNELKTPYTQEEFQKQLTSRNMSMQDLRAKIRRDLSVQKLFNKEITSQISISDKDITDAYNANKGDFNLAEPRIHLSQILVTPAAQAGVRNLKGDKAQTDDQAKQKIVMIANRIASGEDFDALARNYSEDPNTAPNGGDLGFIPESSLERANPELRKMIATLNPGQVSKPAHSQDGYRIFKVIAREPAGQRELNDPRVQQTIRETLINRKDQLLKNAYYEVARNDAKVINQYAQQVWQNKGKAK